MSQSKDLENLVVIASSTGGPKSLQAVVPKLERRLNAAVIIVQHMPAGFTASLADRLNDLSNIRVKEAEDGERLNVGTVYIAKGGQHLKVVTFKGKSGSYLKLTDEPPREGVRPCANYTYESLADTPIPFLMGVVLTGMGADATAGIRNLKQTRDIYTVAQDEKTSIIYGMPKVVAESGLANRILPLDNIAEEINKKVGVL